MACFLGNLCVFFGGCKVVKTDPFFFGWNLPKLGGTPGIYCPIFGFLFFIIFMTCQGDFNDLPRYTAVDGNFSGIRYLLSFLGLRNDLPTWRFFQT